MRSRWPKLAGLLVVIAGLSACAYVPMTDKDDPIALRVADRWAMRNLPGFAVERTRLTPHVESRGPFWAVIYVPRPGQTTGVPQIVVSKAGGRIVRVDYGQ